MAASATLSTAELASLEGWFAEFVAGFRAPDPADQRNYQLKVEHTDRVRGFMTRLTAAEGLTAGQQRLAEAVALCHDVGRFPQFQQYRTFKDSDSVNHAALGVRTLRERGALDRLAPEARELILQGVALHNAFVLPAGLKPAVLRLARLIRDADKLDIWRVFCEYFEQPAEERASAVGLGFPDLPGCTPEVVATLRDGRMINLATLRTLNDFKLLQLSWVFDLNFPESFRLVRELRYLGRLAALLPAEVTVWEALAVVMAHVARRAEGGR